jgi:hypothetical protein
LRPFVVVYPACWLGPATGGGCVCGSRWNGVEKLRSVGDDDALGVCVCVARFVFRSPFLPDSVPPKNDAIVG